jgi:hypothetical protein
MAQPHRCSAAHCLATVWETNMAARTLTLMTVSQAYETVFPAFAYSLPDAPLQ